MLLVVLATFPFTAPFSVCDLSDLTHATPLHVADGFVADSAKDTQKPPCLGPTCQIAMSQSFGVLVARSLLRRVTPTPSSTNLVLRV